MQHDNGHNASKQGGTATATGREPPRVGHPTLGGRIVNRYRVPSPNQEAIRAAFQEKGWPHRIDNPLSPLPDPCRKGTAAFDDQVPQRQPGEPAHPLPRRRQPRRNRVGIRRRPDASHSPHRAKTYQNGVIFCFTPPPPRQIWAGMNDLAAPRSRPRVTPKPPHS